MDKLRRCVARDKDGHRCRLHMFHAVETRDPKTGMVKLVVSDTPHKAFGKEW